MHANRSHVGLGALLAIALTIIGAASANAATTSKPYSLNIQPGTPSYEATPGVVASGEKVSITATFTNETSTQQIGSANLFWPTGFNVPGPKAPPPTITSGNASVANSCSYLGSPGGPCVTLRNLAVPPGGSVTVTMSVTTPVGQAGSNHPWLAEVKQANNYSGSPGNDLFLSNPTSDTVDSTLDGATSLKFGVEPTATRTLTATQPNETISGQAYVPEDKGGPALTVQVLGANGPILTSEAPVTMALGNNPTGATLGGTTLEFADGTNGTASFGDLSLGVPGFGYTLAASSGPPSGPLTGDTSDPFDVQDQAVSCMANLDCPLTAPGNSGTNNQLKIDLPLAPGSGQLVESTFGKAPQATLCGNYTPTDPNSYESVYTPDPGTAPRAEVDTITIVPTKKLAGSVQQVLKAQQVCFGNTTDFVTASGATTSTTPPDATPTTLPDGKAGFVGLLPTCTGSTPGPCLNRQLDTTVRDDSSPTLYDIVLVVDVPAAWTDYWRC